VILLYIILIPLGLILFSMIVTAFSSYSTKEKEKRALEDYNKLEDMGGKYLDGIWKVIKTLFVLLLVFLFFSLVLNK